MIVVFDASSLVSAALKADSNPERALLRAITAPNRLIVSAEVEAELAKLAREVLGCTGRTFVRQGFSITTAALPAALVFAGERSCPICSPTLAPFCSHADEIAFLISKEDIQSLRENGQDHGLDYHLRVAFDIPHQVGHLVGEQLSEMGLVDLVTMINVRTG